MGKLFNRDLFVRNIRRLVKEELIDLFLTVVLSTIMEILKLIFVWTRSDQAKEGNISLSELYSAINNMETFEVVLNIILLTLIIWSVTCISKIFENGNAGRKNKLHTSAVWTSFILAFVWYVLEGAFKFDSVKIVLYLVLYGILLISMITYFSKSGDSNYIKSKYECDHRIA